ncbi:ubiquinone biosynthesis O-methyltransferase [mine drainage metagenome]|uniref:Ubiquinone biosynthesis O-methyltransferase n=1 Tax=mine drainage metagenome TaxID=410659 RepID=A0A1J5S6L6_9ZZZZ
MKLNSILELPVLYKLFSTLVGAQNSQSIFVNQYVRPVTGARILDIGCGPGNILDHLPQVDYFGFDFNPSYIESATRRYGDRGQFFCQRVSEAQVFLEQPESFDIVLAIGILHHLDDAEAIQLFDIAKRALKKGGRLVTFDGCYVKDQSPAAKYLLSRDRGQFVRDEKGYTDLARARFDNVVVSIRNDLLHIPYTHIMLECMK